MKMPVKHAAALIAATLRSSGFKKGEAIMILAAALQMLRRAEDA